MQQKMVWLFGTILTGIAVGQVVTLNTQFSSGEDVMHDAKLDQPHIVLVVADDLGYNDIGYHNKHVLTPVLDKLARDGVILENFYSMPTCTPSRAALLTGIHPVRTGMHRRVIRLNMKTGLPLELELLPERLKKLGYATHAIGKWHLGHFKKEYLPHNRGFDTFFGSLSGGLDSYTHMACEQNHCGYDWRLNDEILYNETGVFGTHSLTRRAEHVIHSHPKQKPLFLYLPYHAPHGPLMVPEKYLKLYENVPIDLTDRRIHGAMVSCLDEGIGNVTTALKDAGLYNNSVIIFISDNGGQVIMGGNNYPLRGWKSSVSEGGVRVPAFVHSPLLLSKQRGKITRSVVHITDWMPTILRLAGDSSVMRELDGRNVWSAIEGDKTPRWEMLYTLMDTRRYRENKPFDTTLKAALRFNEWKIVTGEDASIIWAPPSRPGAREWKPKKVTCRFLKTNSYCTTRALTRASKWCIRLKKWCRISRPTHLRKQKKKTVRLYNLNVDPEERNDLSSTHPGKVRGLLRRLKKYHERTVAPVKVRPVPMQKLNLKIIGPFQ